MTTSSAANSLTWLAPLLRVRPEVQDFCRFGGDWLSSHDAEKPGWAYFHIVARGECRIERPGRATLALKAGNILLLPHGSAHVVRARIGSTGPGTPIVTEYRNAIRRKTSLGVDATTELICGRLHFEDAAENLIVAALPELIVLHVGERPVTDRFRALMLCICEELDRSDMGAAAIATDLASAMFMMMLRQHLASHPPVEGLLALLGQRAAAQAVLAMLHDPAHEWTLDELAERAVASRATLVRLFRRTAGVAPLAFLTELRLMLARQRLAASGDPIGQIAADVGYQSEAALSRAFLRRFGVRPGKFRGDGAAPKPEPPPSG